jgi:hypothetical protein
MGYEDENETKLSTRTNANLVYCMVSGIGSVGDNIRAAHLVPAVSKPEILRQLSMRPSDVDDVRNGLLLARHIEAAYDKLEVSFVKNPLLTDGLILKIWNPELKGKLIFPDSNYKIGDFENAPLCLTFRNGKTGAHEPFMRALSYQAYMAYLKWNYGECPVDYSSDFNTDISKMRGYNESLKDLQKTLTLETGGPDMKDSEESDNVYDDDVLDDVHDDEPPKKKRETESG